MRLPWRRSKRDSSGGDHDHLAAGSAPGWEAIDAQLAAAYPGIEPIHWGTLLRWRLGGPDPLDGVSAYAVNAGGIDHWHYVSYGLSELYAKETDDRDVSGWGFELTFRLAPTDGADGVAPLWPVNLMQNIARYVFSSGNVLQPGDHIDLNGPIALEHETAITAAALAVDPQLGAIETPNGRVAFIQVVGLTADEYQAAMDWDTTRILALLRERNEFLVTDLRRPTLLSDSAMAERVAGGIRRDGSSMSSVNVDRLTVEDVGAYRVVTIGAVVVDRVQKLLRGRIPFGRSFSIHGPDSILHVDAGERVEWNGSSDHPTLFLTADAAVALADGLQPIVGVYQVPDVPVRLVVETTIIRDQDGNEVGRIG